MVHLQNKQLIWLIGILIEYLQITIPSGNIFENVPTSKKANILKRAYNLFQTVNNIEGKYWFYNKNCIIKFIFK